MNHRHQKKDTRQVRFSYPTYAFDETNLLPDAGLVPLLALADRAGLHKLLADRLSVSDANGAGHAAAAKITTIIAGMAAGAPHVAFTGRRKAEHLPGRLIVRRVKRVNPKAVPAGQGELFNVWRHHVVFTDIPDTAADGQEGDAGGRSSSP